MAVPTLPVRPHTAGTHRGLAAIFTSKSQIFFPRKLKPERFQPNPLFIHLISVLRGNSARELWIHPHDFPPYGLQNQAWSLKSSRLVSPKPVSGSQGPRVPGQRPVPGEGRQLTGSRSQQGPRGLRPAHTMARCALPYTHTPLHQVPRPTVAHGPHQEHL